LVLANLEWDSTPGIPLNKVATTNGELFGWNGVTIDQTKTRFVYKCVQLRWEELKTQPSLDPLNFFIKLEPHKLKKKVDKAWRLIHGVSIVDNLVSRILLGGFCDQLIEQYTKLPNKAGWSPASGGYKWLYNQLPLKKLMADKSAWDFTMQGWVVQVFCALFDRKFSSWSAETKIILGNHFAALFHGCVYTVGRFRVRQCAFGIMKTGSFLTIAFNSIAQVILHLLASFRSCTNWKRTLPHALGDDTIQSAAVSQNYLTELRQTGCIIKECEVSESCTFGGHVFNDRDCKPAYGSKHSWLLQHLDPETAKEAVESYQYLYALCPEQLAFIQSILLKLHPGALRSTSFLAGWYNGVE